MILSIYTGNTGNTTNVPTFAPQQTNEIQVETTTTSEGISKI